MIRKYILPNCFARQGVSNFVFHCLDINAQMLARGQAACSTTKPDLSFCLHRDRHQQLGRPKTSYDIVIANQSLHHVVELELLFEKTHRCLRDSGFFLTNDMIGRNGHMRWPEALELVQACWTLLDEKQKWNCQLKRHEEVYENWDCSLEGFEGIRSQDILPLLVKTFHFDCFLGFANAIGVFVARAFGHNFDISNPKDCYFIDFVSQLDEYFIETGKLKPTQMIAAMRKHGRIAHESLQTPDAGILHSRSQPLVKARRRATLRASLSDSARYLVSRALRNTFSRSRRIRAITLRTPLVLSRQCSAVS